MKRDKHRYANDPEYGRARLETARKYRERHRQKIKEQARRHYWNNREAILHREQVRRESDVRYSERKSVRIYGISLEEYDLMRARQKDVCAICKKPPSTRRRLFVDHCHLTNKVRGVLCQKCNSGIGLLGDNLDVLRAAAAYLEGSLDEQGQK
jgi:hypothetical protein